MTAPPSPTVLILAAVEREMAPVRRLLEERTRRGALPYEPRLVLTGVGKASAACEAAIALREVRPVLAAQVGCAGAYPGTDLAPGDVVISRLEVLADEGVEAPAGFLDLERLGLPTGRRGPVTIYNRIPVRSPRFETWKVLLDRVAGRFQVRSATTATVSTVSGTDRRAQEIASRWDAVAESMEGAGAALAALRLDCGLFEVRGISNITGDRDRSAWEIDRACANAAEVALHLLEIEH